ncbi:tetratricopeptide repeat protein [Myxococcus stipitatus]|uniref:tetratricopeptide repeat protein n=1 Tax=Myxococcus stipitatus TaxID=83455 RepID=UPI0031450D58
MTLATLLLVALTVGQVGEETPPPASPAPAAVDTLSAPPLMPTPDPCPEEAEALYTRGFDAFTRGKDREAARAFDQVLEMCPQHPHATELGRLAKARLVPGAKLARAAAAPVNPVNGERRSGGATASLMVVQTLHGATQGILLCAIAECSSQGYATSAMLAAGLGATSSALLAQGGITSGQAAAVNSGTVWGLWFGISSIYGFDMNEERALATAMIGGLAFTGVGALVASTVQPTSGQVSMVNSGGLWTGIVTALFLSSYNDVDTEKMFIAGMAASSAGILGLSFLAQDLPVSRGRILLIDAGGVLGGLLGASTMFMFTQNDEDAILFSAGLGAVGGLALVTYLTRDFDGPALPQAVLTPAIMGRNGAGLAMAGRF